MEPYEDFCTVLRDFGRMLGGELSFDEEGDCMIVMDADSIVNLHYLEHSDSVVLWSSIGQLPPDEKAGGRAMLLLQMHDLGLESRGFTFGMESEDNRLVAFSTRPAAQISTVDILSVWVDNLLKVEEDVVKRMAEEFPYDDEEEPLPGEDEEVRMAPASEDAPGAEPEKDLNP